MQPKAIFALLHFLLLSEASATTPQDDIHSQTREQYQKYVAVKESLFSSDFIKRSKAVASIRGDSKILPSTIEYKINNHNSPIECNQSYSERIKEVQQIIKEYSTEIETSELSRLRDIAKSRSDELIKNNTQDCTNIANSLIELTTLTSSYLDQAKKQENEKSELKAMQAAEDAKRQREHIERTKMEQEQSKRLIESLNAAEQKAKIVCNSKISCDKAFSLTQIFINEYSDMKIQIANETIIETYNATSGTAIAARAVKIPRSGSQSEIKLTLSCKPDTERRFFECQENKLLIYTKFPSYMKNILRN